MRIKLSSVASDLLSVGLCILWALARGEGDPKKLAALGEERLRHREEQLIDALAGSPQPMHRELLSLQLERLQLLHEQIARLNQRHDRAGAETISRGGGPAWPKCLGSE